MPSQSFVYCCFNAAQTPWVFPSRTSTILITTAVFYSSRRTALAFLITQVVKFSTAVCFTWSYRNTLKIDLDWNTQEHTGYSKRNTEEHVFLSAFCYRLNKLDSCSVQLWGMRASNDVAGQIKEKKLSRKLAKIEALETTQWSTTQCTIICRYKPQGKEKLGWKVSLEFI